MLSLNTYIFTTQSKKSSYIIGNWKSYMNRDQTIQLSQNIKNIYTDTNNDNRVIVLPSSLFYSEVAEIFKETNIKVGMQYVSPYCRGAYTGEINTAMLKSVDCKYCMVGHYERKRYFFEGEESIYKSVYKLLQMDITPIFCMGDTNEEYLEGNSISRCITQVGGLLRYLKNNQVSKEKYAQILIAYEPIWAIGTGIIPSKMFLEQLYYSLHNYVSYQHHYNPIILYGGSVSMYNLKQMEVFDGLLVGQSSTNEERFMNICELF
jgi:triosephosphate isomerase